MKWRYLPSAALLLGLLLTADPAQGQTKAALEVIPDDVIGYALINGLEQVNDKIQAVAKKAQTPLPLSPLGFLKTLVGIDKGINERGTVALAGLDNEEEPIPLLFVPVTNYAEAMAGLGVKEPKEINEVEILGKGLVLGKKGDFIVATEAKHKDVLQKVLAGKKSIASTAVGIEGYLADNDVVAVVPPAGIKKMCVEAKKGMGELKNQALLQPPFAADYVDWLNNFIRAAETEVPNIAIGLKVDPQQNILKSVRVQFKKGGEFAKFGADIKPLSDGPLYGLPDGPAAFAMGGVYPENFLKNAMQMNTQLLKSLDQLDKKEIEKLENAYAMAAKGMRGMGMSVGLPRAGQSFMASISAVIKAENAEEYISNYIKAMEVTGEVYKKAPNLPFPAMGAKSIKIGDAPGAEVEIDLSMNAQLGENEKKIIEKIMGEGGKMHVTMVAADKNTVLVRYTHAKETAKALEAYRKNASGLGGNQEIARTAALLPERSQWVMYLGVKELVDITKSVVNEFAPGVVQIPNFPQTPPIGIGAEISDSGFELRLVVPAGVVENLGKFIKEIQQQQGNFL